MKKFMITYHAPAEAWAQTATATESEKAKGMEAWMHWKERCGEHVIDLGSPLTGGQALNAAKNWQNGHHGICGYSVLQGNDINQVKGLLTDHPHLNWYDGCEIEVHEVASM